ncbi:hypothetical protein Kfla_6834 [Kribbella flavida DSM 17836]|uniref:TPM domain-containing protein n=1 Tax=Kribbella flavida (strain DSM 17836 / JCM 10339 / NBRC 14399) TaxID=479435 RepID=D2Q2C9_KRIFD|nr:hypothetical protein [Kribbella flavida]ADB35825.1 hypothetical protein Kfla_6834 [Kribbella flavida DSM 17836]
MSARSRCLAALLLALLAVVPAGPAHAVTPELPDQIAAAWRQDPIYVEPAMRPAFPRSELDRIRAASAAAGFGVYVAILPRDGFDRERYAEFPTLLQGRVGQPGLYLVWTVSDEYWSGDELLVRAGGLKGRSLTRVQVDDEQDNKIVTDRPAPRIVRTIQQAGTAYDGRPLPDVPASDLKESAQRERSGPSATDKEDRAAFTGMGIGGLAGFLLVLILVLRSWKHRPAPSRRRTSGRSRELPAQAASSAAEVKLSTVTSQADRWIPKAGRALRALEKQVLAASRAGDDADAARRERTRARLDRRDDAGARLEAARTLRKAEPDDVLAVTGAFVLARQAFQVAEGNDLLPPCFFDPTHPSGTMTAAWADDTEVPACKTCAQTVSRGETPLGLRVAPAGGLFGIDRTPVPYWTLDPENPMVATGFGALSDDLAERVERIYGGVR